MSADPRHEQWSDAIRQLVEGASDEQLAGMTGPDRRFYAEEAVLAAEAELEGRKAAGATSSRWRFNTAAMALGPFWYVYNGMAGRGAIIAALALGAALGLQPVARSVGIPSVAWIVAVVVAVALYCGFFAERDAAESAAQARTTAPRRGAARRSAGPEPSAAPRAKLAVVAQVGCRDAAEHARALLRKAGIEAVVTRSKDGDGEEQTRVLVPEAERLRARGMIQSFLSSPASECLD